MKIEQHKFINCVCNPVDYFLEAFCTLECLNRILREIKTIILNVTEADVNFRGHL